MAPNRTARDIIIDFVTSIGISVIKRPIEKPCFLPGLQLENGCLIIDGEKLLYPGDILHEAGHLATMTPGIRAGMSDALANNDQNQGGEMMAIAWSYAACIYLNLPPQTVFHPHGYKGGSEWMLQNFAEGRYIGLPLLQWAGMTYDEKRAREVNACPFPKMMRWTREE